MPRCAWLGSCCSGSSDGWRQLVLNAPAAGRIMLHHSRLSLFSLLPLGQSKLPFLLGSASLPYPGSHAVLAPVMVAPTQPGHDPSARQTWPDSEFGRLGRPVVADTRRAVFNVLGTHTLTMPRRRQQPPPQPAQPCRSSTFRRPLKHGFPITQAQGKTARSPVYSPQPPTLSAQTAHESSAGRA